MARNWQVTTVLENLFVEFKQMLQVGVYQTPWMQMLRGNASNNQASNYT